MNATMSRTETKPRQDRIARLFIDMITQRGRELAEIPPHAACSPAQRSRRDELAMEVETLRHQLRRHVAARVA